MTDVRTFCRVCEPACGLVATVADGALTALRPDREHPVSRGWACNKGIATLDVHRDPDRLSHPLRRTDDGGFARVSWDDAMAGIADRLREIRATRGEWATAVYLGNPTAFNALASVGTTPFLQGLGTRQIYSAGTQDCSNKFAASEYVFGSSTLHPLPDFDHTDYCLILGSNPGVSHMSFVSIAEPIEVLRAIERRGGKVRFVNPRRIESVKSGVGELIQIRPDTDVWFLAALLHELERIGGFDEAVLAAHGTHVDGLRAFIAAYPPERACAVTGCRPRPFARSRATGKRRAVRRSRCRRASTWAGTARSRTGSSTCSRSRPATSTAGAATSSRSATTRRPHAPAAWIRRRRSSTRASAACATCADRFPGTSSRTRS
jgi:anaerobic selenocysteine-containing dehydrogenase